jgi:SNF2 family DNA or RNA helicase
VGLGKTVEVLACILANPRPLALATTESESSVTNQTTTTTATAKRRLNFCDNDQHEEKTPSTASTEDTMSAEPGAAGNDGGIVGDLNDFCDADYDDESSLSSAKETNDLNGSSNERDANIPQRLGTVEQKGPVAPTTGVPVIPVTPDDKNMARDGDGTAPAVKEADEDEDVRWVEDDEPLGSCICGNLIGLHDLKNASIVFCPDCDEPMHMECAAFASEEEMESASSPLVYRRLFTNEQWTSRLLSSPTDDRCMNWTGKGHCHYCPCCIADTGRLIPSRATLIVTPPAILSQWKREIQRHTQQQGPDGKPCLRVVVYEGVAKTAKYFGPRKQDVASRMELVHPHKLADADVVLLTYDTLRADLGHSDGNPFLTADGASNLRKRKRYRVVPSPLTSIHWWRVCLDEAQRVESTTVLSAQMALKLQCEYRWGITGTPIGRGRMEDLYGLLLFLRMKPFTWKLLFNKCFNSEFFGVGDRIRCLLQNLFWRSTKDFQLVREQMGVPEQLEVKVHLRFSSIEKHFYDRQLEQTLLTAGDVVERERSGKKRKRKELDLLAEQLHRLRAACCHPQVGSSGLNKKQRPGTRKKRRPGAGKAATGAATVTAGKKTASTEKEETSAVCSRVMTMDEILTRFIEDAKLKCEESQRLAVMHTNAMAAISRLKVEARDRGIAIDQTDAQLLTQSCKVYLESLDMAEENGRPTHVLGNAIMMGTTGFLSSRKSMRDGAAQMDWKLPGNATSSLSPPPEVWARVDFEGPSRKLVQVRVRPIREIPVLLLSETSDDFVWRLLHPKTVVFQVASAAVGGEFVDVGEMACHPPFSLPAHDAQDDNEDSGDSDSWVVEGGFRTNKSKSWRLVVKSYYDDDVMESQRQDHLREEPSGLYVGLDVQLLEADIASDALQRLHCLHNASLSFSSLLQVRENRNDRDESLSAFPNFATSTDLTQRLVTMKKEAEKIESLYMDVARSLHQECHRRFEECSTSRCKLEAELLELSRASPLSVPGNRSRLQDCWDDGWWDDFLAMCHVHGTEFHLRTLCERVLDELDRLQGGPERGLIRFPTFRDLNGLRVALSSRIQGIRSGIGKEAAWIGTHDDEQPEHQTLYQFREDRFHCSRGMFAKCMQEIGSFSPTPSDKEMFENSHCRVCKADWNQQGPTCRHCHIGNMLNELEPDRVTLCLLNSIYGVLRGPVGRTVCDNDNGACIDERAKKFFDILESQKKEKVFAWRHWRTHLDLLNDLDELGQCKASMRLSLEEEDLTTLTDDQLNAIVVPIDLNTRYHDHAAKQAMALGDLRRAKDTLRYLRNQSGEQQQARSRQEEEQCLVCYEPFDTDRAVLQCGHSFHFTPCLNKLQARTTIGGSICCPLRCRVRTHPSKVMIASEKRHDDGSRSKRSIQGSWGTKVTRLVSDLLDVQDVGDKAVLFSQWDDMLDIVQQALIANGIRHVRATSSKETGDFVNRFRAVDCTALLLNVKHGAEGLTIVEATHVFMVEPLMNHGLDLQAISRVCRIGQTKKTYVHRYIMQGTVEVKIDAVRMEHQGDNLEDAILEGKNTTIRAGGIDGGFRSETELLDLLHIPGDDDENKASAPAAAIAREA